MANVVGGLLAGLRKDEARMGYINQQTGQQLMAQQLGALTAGSYDYNTDAYRISGITTSDSSVYRIANVAPVAKPKTESAVEWLDRRVAEMRVKL